VVLPRQLRGRRFQLHVLAAEPARAVSGKPAVGIGELRGRGLPRKPRAPRASALPCSAGGAVSGQGIGMRPIGSLRDFDAGRPLPARNCFGPIALGAGPQELRIDAGVLRVHSLRLRSAAPAARPAPSGGGRVLDPGDQGRGKWEGVRVEVDGPSRLVLGESFNPGWRASCDGDDLGDPEVVDGFANGWRVAPGCEDVEFAFAPQRFVDVGYAIGGLACLVLLALLLVGGRRRAPAPSPPPADLSIDDRPHRLPLRQALIGGVAAGAVFGFVFALRAGVLIGPGVAFILWRGFSPRQLILAAGALLALVVPALYLLFPAEDRGGYNNEYAVEHLGAHWVAVAAFVLLVLALAGTLMMATRSNRADRPETTRSH
jgi:arabinofuranan 3-O-arabinosyltransferase